MQVSALTLARPAATAAEPAGLRSRRVICRRRQAEPAEPAGLGFAFPARGGRGHGHARRRGVDMPRRERLRVREEVEIGVIGVVRSSSRSRVRVRGVRGLGAGPRALGRRLERRGGKKVREESAWDHSTKKLILI